MSHVLPLKAQDFDDFHQESFDCFWTEVALQESCTKPHSFVRGVRSPEEKLWAFLVYQVLGQEAEIHAFHVHKDVRRQSLGAKLLDHMLDVVQKEGADKVFLEVREDNIPAINLYTSRDFKVIDRRLKYYTLDTGQKKDALILERLF